MIKYCQFMRQRVASITVVSFLACFFLLSFGSAVRESATFDEPVHLVSGYAFWKTGLYNMEPVNPPVLRLWAAFPLLLIHAPWPERAAAHFVRDPWSLSYLWLLRG